MLKEIGHGAPIQMEKVSTAGLSGVVRQWWPNLAAQLPRELAELGYKRRLSLALADGLLSLALP